jgi:hypothetical protein
MGRTAGSFGSSLSMRVHPQLAVTRFDSHLPLLSLRPRVHGAPLPRGLHSRQPSLILFSLDGLR